MFQSDIRGRCSAHYPDNGGRQLQAMPVGYGEFCKPRRIQSTAARWIVSFLGTAAEGGHCRSNLVVVAPFRALFAEHASLFWVPLSMFFSGLWLFWTFFGRPRRFLAVFLGVFFSFYPCKVGSPVTGMLDPWVLFFLAALDGIPDPWYGTEGGEWYKSSYAVLCTVAQQAAGHMKTGRIRGELGWQPTENGHRLPNSTRDTCPRQRGLSDGRRVCCSCHQSINCSETASGNGSSGARPGCRGQCRVSRSIALGNPHQHQKPCQKLLSPATPSSPAFI